MISLKEMPKWLLTAVVRRMPGERHEWGAAMLAELAQLQNPFTRWRFALGCAWVALFPPNKDGLLQTRREFFHSLTGSLTRRGFVWVVALPGSWALLYYAF